MTMSAWPRRITVLASAIALVCAGCAGVRPSPAPEAASAAAFKAWSVRSFIEG